MKNKDIIWNVYIELNLMGYFMHYIIIILLIKFIKSNYYNIN